MFVSGVPLYICNDHVYGFVMVPLEQSDSLELDLMQLTNLKLEVLGKYLVFILKLINLIITINNSYLMFHHMSIVLRSSDTFLLGYVQSQFTYFLRSETVIAIYRMKNNFNQF